VLLCATILALSPVAAPTTAAAALPVEAHTDDVLDDEERSTIEWLIARVAGLPELRFVRNGRAYYATAAARFLREKWQANADAVTSIEAFIEIVATRSATTGRHYLIRYGDGREVASAAFFRDLLAERSSP
jgi:hypothetical protein